MSSLNKEVQSLFNDIEMFISVDAKKPNISGSKRKTGTNASTSSRSSKPIYTNEELFNILTESPKENQHVSNKVDRRRSKCKENEKHDKNKVPNRPSCPEKKRLSTDEVETLPKKRGRIKTIDFASVSSETNTHKKHEKQCTPLQSTTKEALTTNVKETKLHHCREIPPKMHNANIVPVFKPNFVIKKEVIDLTDDDICFFNVTLKFAKETEVAVPVWEDFDSLPPAVDVQRIEPKLVTIEACAIAICTQAKVEFPVRVINEKNREENYRKIAHYIYEFYNFQKTVTRMKMAFQEVYCYLEHAKAQGEVQLFSEYFDNRFSSMRKMFLQMLNQMKIGYLDSNALAKISLILLNTFGNDYAEINIFLYCHLLINGHCNVDVKTDVESCSILIPKVSAEFPEAMEILKPDLDVFPKFGGPRETFNLMFTSDSQRFTSYNSMLSPPNSFSNEFTVIDLTDSA